MPILCRHSSPLNLLFKILRKRKRKKLGRGVTGNSRASTILNIFLEVLSSYWWPFPEQNAFAASCIHYSCYYRVGKEVYSTCNTCTSIQCVCWTYSIMLSNNLQSLLYLQSICRHLITVYSDSVVSFWQITCQSGDENLKIKVPNGW